MLRTSLAALAIAVEAYSTTPAVVAPVVHPEATHAPVSNTYLDDMAMAPRSNINFCMNQLQATRDTYEGADLAAATKYLDSTYSRDGAGDVIGQYSFMVSLPEDASQMKRLAHPYLSIGHYSNTASAQSYIDAAEGRANEGETYLYQSHFSKAGSQAAGTVVMAQGVKTYIMMVLDGTSNTERAMVACGIANSDTATTDQSSVMAEAGKLGFCLNQLSASRSAYAGGDTTSMAAYIKSKYTFGATAKDVVGQYTFAVELPANNNASQMTRIEHPYLPIGANLPAGAAEKFITAAAGKKMAGEEFVFTQLYSAAASEASGTHVTSAEDSKSYIAMVLPTTDGGEFFPSRILIACGFVDTGA